MSSQGQLSKNVNAYHVQNGLVKFVVHGYDMAEAIFCTRCMEIVWSKFQSAEACGPSEYEVIQEHVCGHGCTTPAATNVARIYKSETESLIPLVYQRCRALRSLPLQHPTLPTPKVSSVLMVTPMLVVSILLFSPTGARSK